MGVDRLARDRVRAGLDSERALSKPRRAQRLLAQEPFDGVGVRRGFSVEIGDVFGAPVALYNRAFSLAPKET